MSASVLASSNLAAKLEVRQIPPVHLVRLKLQVVGLPLKVEEGHVLDPVPQGVRHHALAVDAEEAAPKGQSKSVM